MNGPDERALAVLAHELEALLRSRNLRLATAESCTGGYLSKLITDIPGSSDWFDCGWVCYSNRAKQRDLGVREATLATHGAVSDPVVRELALGALAASGADRAIAISGVAGPSGGTLRNPVGTVWFGQAARNEGSGAGPRVAAERRQWAGNRDAVRRQSVAFALEWLLAF